MSTPPAPPHPPAPPSPLPHLPPTPPAIHRTLAGTTTYPIASSCSLSGTRSARELLPALAARDARGQSSRAHPIPTETTLPPRLTAAPEGARGTLSCARLRGRGGIRPRAGKSPALERAGGLRDDVVEIGHFLFLAGTQLLGFPPSPQYVVK